MDQVFPTAPVSAQVITVADVTTVKVLALRLIEQLKEAKKTQKVLNEQKTSILENDTELAKAQSEVEPLLNAMKVAKKAVESHEDYKRITAKAKELKDEIAGIEESLSNHLDSYVTLTGSRVIEDGEGKEYKIRRKMSISSGQLKLF